MRLGQLPHDEIVRRLRGDGLAFSTGPFGVRVRSVMPAIAVAVPLLYEHHPVLDADTFCDCTLELAPPAGLRRWFRPQVAVRYDGHPLFEPLPIDQAFPLLEWTLNWWISNHAHQYLLLHAAVLEREGRAVVLPAPPGSGKSTLCAALSLRGWRLLSDELAMVSLATGQIEGLARPVSLKNRSLDVIGHFAPEAVFSETVHETTKGTVAHMKPQRAAVERMHEAAASAWVVFPRYVAGAAAELLVREKADAMMELGRNAFNYPVLGRDGFDTLVNLVSASRCYDFSYSRLDDAIRIFDAIAGGDL